MNRSQVHLLKGSLILIFGVLVATAVLLIYAIVYVRHGYLTSSFTIRHIPVDTFLAGLTIGTVVYFSSLWLNFKLTKSFWILLCTMPLIVYIILLGIYYETTYISSNLNGVSEDVLYSDFGSFKEFLNDYRRSFYQSEYGDMESETSIGKMFGNLLFIGQALALYLGVIIIPAFLDSKEYCESCSKYFKREIKDRRSFNLISKFETHNQEISLHFTNRDPYSIARTQKESSIYRESAPLTAKLEVYSCKSCKHILLNFLPFGRRGKGAGITMGTQHSLNIGPNAGVSLNELRRILR